MARTMLAADALRNGNRRESALAAATGLRGKLNQPVHDRLLAIAFYGHTHPEPSPNRSGRAILNSAISGNSGRQAGPRRAWRGGVFDFVERLWRSVKYERVYLRAYDSVSAARADIADYMGWYNEATEHP